MGGFTGDGTPPPAPDYPPENAFDIQAFTSQLADELVKRKILTPEGALKWKHEPGWLEKEILAIIADSGLAVAVFLRVVLEAMRPTLETLVTVASEVLEPGMETLANLTSVYVHGVGGIPPGETGGKLPVGSGPAAAPAGLVFDKIMAPLLNILTPRNPSSAGAGEENAQAILGTIVNLHLSTWMVNIISNLTGMGYLKWINSFDDAILSGISARGFSRLASKPYLEKYVVTPLTKDLNRAWPVTTGSVSQLVKRYIRGNMTAAELKAALRAQGFDDEVVADLLLDTVKYPSLETIAFLVKWGFWSTNEGIVALRHQGYTHEIAATTLSLEVRSVYFAQMRSMASSLVDAFIDHRIDVHELAKLLDQAGFTKDEVDAQIARGEVLQQLPQRLSLSQVKSLFQEDLVDLDYVMRFLQDEGYGADEVDLLALLEFTRKEDREQRRADLLERRRISLEAQLGFEAQADRARLEELEALGGPTP